MASHPEPVWSALLDDEAPLALPGATAPPHPSLRALVVRDTDLPLLRGSTAPLHLVVTGGAGQVAGPAGLASRLGLTVVGLEVALRDPDDLAGNARRVVAAVDVARAEGVLGEDVPVHVELPADEPTHGWLAAADEVAAAELRLTLRPDGASPALLAAWTDAALDRETPFRCSGGGPGPLPLLVATRLAFDGASRDEVVATLGSRDGAALAAANLTGVRRWVTSIGAQDVVATLAELRTLGLVP
ncbi:hypothetical protein NPS01_23190 [Nocardioides psychrotolerans]|uniref:Uncharacterized protein n=1 Tax=Nocardioides psychrotolerans TaxID=1005945 RepID=A0A1I3I0A4_9ACTN|nr:hypothetical protein [Nocardioides psychrotolerans]GEP38656.1 hypothetical protein NPS01_23190 [Nocardioides psychrotolerans]SFI41404.1 hypothetical protein SAMN05216561_10866 [Nocardioides psychrotolerans]